MGIFRNLLKAVGYEKKGIPLSTSYNRYYSPVITKTDPLDFYESWVWSCIDTRAKAFAMVDFKLYRLNSKGEVEQILQHELLDLLYKLNSDMTKFDFFELSSIYMDLFRASPMYLDYQGKATPQAIYLVRPEYLKVNRNQDGTVASYIYQIGSYKQTFLKDEIIMLKNFNPRDPDKGLGIIEAVRQTAQQDDYMLQNNSNLLKNEAKPSGIIEVPEGMDDATYKRLQKQFQEKYGGFENVGKAVILTDGMKFTPLSISPKDLDYIESQKFSRDKILSIFKVPKEILGNLEQANRASANAISYIFAKWTMTPIVQKYIDQLNEFLVPMFSDDLYLDYEPLAKEDEEVIINKVNLLTDKVLTKNESRDLLGYDPVENGDVIYQNFSLAPLGFDIPANDTTIKGLKEYKVIHPNRIQGKKLREIKQRILNRNFRANKVYRDIARDIIKGLKTGDKEVRFKIVKKAKKKEHTHCEHEKKLVFKKAKPRINADTRKKFHEHSLKEQDRIEIVWQRELKRYFAQQKTELLDYLEQTYNVKGFNIAEYKAFDDGNAIESLMSIIEPVYFANVMSGIKGAEKFFAPKDYDAEKQDYSMVKLWVQKTAKKIAKDVTTTTISQLVSTITDARKEGLSIQQVQEGIQKVFDTMTDTRAKLIARTETARSFSEAHYRAYEKMGYEKVAYLLDSANCCDECTENSRKEWNINDIRGVVPVHPNCKCDFAPLG